MATVRRGSRREDALTRPAAASRPAAAEAEPAAGTYSWQRSSVPLSRTLTHRDQVETTAALCVLVGLFGAVAIGLIALSVVQLDGTERIVAAALCLVVALLLGTLIGYLVLTPLGPRPARQRRASSSRSSSARP